MEGEAFNIFFGDLMNGQMGVPKYLGYVDNDLKGKMDFGRYFNPDLLNNSQYFHALGEVMKCVEKHQGVSED